MYSASFKAVPRLAIIGFALLLNQFGHAAVSFTVTPASISNTYNGTITLQITGLAAGDTVHVQKFLDLNTNGVVDAGDILWQDFQLTDGSAAIFHDGSSAVTNFNVPGDTDGLTNGSITAKLYPAADFSQVGIAKYLFVLSSPAGHFSPPITNSFTVTNFPYAQSFAGSVVSNGTPVPNALVVVFQPSGDGENPQAAEVANNAGAFSIKMAPGTYSLAAFKSNFVENLNSSPTAMLGAGATITTNLSLSNATQTISGNLIDVNNSSIGLAGFLVPVQSTTGNQALAFTDTNGNYTADVVPGQWKISQNETGLAYKGYLSLQNSRQVDTSTGSVSGVTIALPRETAIFYGKVRDNLGNPLPGVQIRSDDNDNLYEAFGVTDTNGNYVVAALGGGDSWQVHEDRGLANYIFSQQQSNVTLTNGQAFRFDFTALLATNVIAGQVEFNGSPVVGVGVNANATISGVFFSAHADTDTNGIYSLNVGNGSWSVSVNCNGGNDSLDTILGPGNYQCPNSQTTNINNNNATANFTIIPVGSGQIFGHVMDSDGNAIVGVAVHADDGLGDIFSNSTDGSGTYSLVVADGSWTVSVDCAGLNSLGYQCIGGTNVNVADDSNQQDFTVPANNPSLPFSLLHTFSTVNTNAFNNDGASPNAGLILSGGTLYGTAFGGGASGNGTVFAVSTNGLVFTNLYSFTAMDANGFNNDGAFPQGALILSGNTLYGTAQAGGSSSNGTVFRISTNGSAFTNLHSFTVTDTNGFNADGVLPLSGLALSGTTLFGTGGVGGVSGDGTIFAINTSGLGFTNLHSLAATDTNGFNNEGAFLIAGLVLSGNTLYGASVAGGTSGNGTIFGINTNSTGFTNLHNFNFSDGNSPEATLILSGNTLYGTANMGGSLGYGVVFAINTDGTGFTNLHNFLAQSDGANPTGGLVLSGNTLYGTATGGGNPGGGTVFSVKTNGTQFVTLHSFTGGNDGANPLGGLVLSGNTLYGTTSEGGSSGNGTVFALSLTAAPPPPAISSPKRVPGNQFQMTVNGTAGQNYTIQMSTNLGATNWTSLLVTNSPTSSFLFTDPNATNSPRFYRILVGP